MLELINRARMDLPGGRAKRSGFLDVTLTAGQGKPVQVLAYNDILRTSAYNHSGWMLLNDDLSITETMDSKSFIAVTSIERMVAHYGYKLGGHYFYGDAWIGKPTIPDFTQSILDQHADLFGSNGSRGRMLDAKFQEAADRPAGRDVRRGRHQLRRLDGDAGLHPQRRQSVRHRRAAYNDTVADNDFLISARACFAESLGQGWVADKSGSRAATSSNSPAPASRRLPSSSLAPISSSTSLWARRTSCRRGQRAAKLTNGSVQSQSTAITGLHALGVSALVLIESATKRSSATRQPTSCWARRRRRRPDGNGGRTRSSAVSSDTPSSKAPAAMFSSTLHARTRRWPRPTRLPTAGPTGSTSARCSSAKPVHRRLAVHRRGPGQSHHG